MESVDYKNVHWTTWDVGGRDKIVSSYIHVLVSKHNNALKHAASTLETLLPKHGRSYFRS